MRSVRLKGPLWSFQVIRYQTDFDWSCVLKDGRPSAMRRFCNKYHARVLALPCALTLTTQHQIRVIKQAHNGSSLTAADSNCMLRAAE